MTLGLLRLARNDTLSFVFATPTKVGGTLPAGNPVMN
jgi:hypothetical protein